MEYLTRQGIRKKFLHYLHPELLFLDVLCLFSINVFYILFPVFFFIAIFAISLSINNSCSPFGRATSSNDQRVSINNDGQGQFQRVTVWLERQAKQQHATNIISPDHEDFGTICRASGATIRFDNWHFRHVLSSVTDAPCCSFHSHVQIRTLSSTTQKESDWVCRIFRKSSQALRYWRASLDEKITAKVISFLYFVSSKSSNNTCTQWKTRRRRKFKLFRTGVSSPTTRNKNQGVRRKSRGAMSIKWN